MSDATNNDSWANTGTPGAEPTAAASAPAAFCQDCGRPLTPDTVRNVGAGVFCEPCLTARVAGMPVGAPSQPAQASPVLAAFLGFIPGVGAMYNGQYAKGIVHFLVFVVLVSLAKDVSGIFGLFVMGWIFYMVFEAYHTAAARRDGIPLPNPFGLNDIGERMGFQSSAGRPSGFAPNAVPPRPVYPPPVPRAAGTGWVGYVPPTAFAGAPPVPPVDPSAAAAAQQAPAWGHAPYAQTYTGGVPPAAPSYAAVPPVAPLPPVSRLPIGAIWLIGLGLLFLLGYLLPDWHFSNRWVLPILFAGLSIWLFTRRLRTGVPVVSILRWPVILMVLAIMFALHAAYFAVTIGLTVAVLLIVIGGMLLLERAATPALPYAAPVSVVPSADPVTGDEAAAQARAAWAAHAPESPAHDAPAESDPSKGGQ